MKDGGPAFPSGERFSLDAAGRRDDRLMEPLHQGVSVRDYFAAHALMGLFGTLALMVTSGFKKPPTDEGQRAALVEEAYAIADAMLAARESAPKDA